MGSLPRAYLILAIKVNIVFASSAADYAAHFLIMIIWTKMAISLWIATLFKKILPCRWLHICPHYFQPTTPLFFHLASKYPLHLLHNLQYHSTLHYYQTQMYAIPLIHIIDFEQGGCHHQSHCQKMTLLFLHLSPVCYLIVHSQQFIVPIHVLKFCSIAGLIKDALKYHLQYIIALYLFCWFQSP